MPPTKKLKLVVWTWNTAFSHPFPNEGFAPMLKKQPALIAGVLDLIEWLKFRTLDGVVYADTLVHPAQPPDLMSEIHVVQGNRKTVFLGLGYDSRAPSGESAATCYLMGLWSASDALTVENFVAAAKAELLAAH